MPAQQQPPCKFCEKKGLPILPIRYGIAPTKSFGVNKFKGVPPDPTILLGKPEVAINAPETIYTGRRLRGGYLYVYYEADHAWEAYAVGEDGCLSWVTLTDEAPPGGDRFHASCARDATKVAIASVLTIQDPETAGTVWIGFSDAWWTKTIRGNIAKDGHKDQYMRKVNVTGWFNNGNPGGAMPKHAFQTYEVGITVAEYAMPLVDGTIAFNFSPFHFHPQSADTLIKECDALVEAKGLVLWLQDPVGLAQELPKYLEFRWASFAEPYSRETTVDAELTQVQAAVERQAVDDLFKDKKGDAASLMRSAGRLGMVGSRAERWEQDKQVTAAELDAARAQAWTQYAAVIDEPKRTAFRSKFATASKAYDKQFMVPLAEAHTHWVQGATMTALLEHHYDPKDINTGVGLTTVVTACVIGTAGYGACQKLYEKWLKAGPSGGSAMNAMWRAIAFNNPELATKLAAVKVPATPMPGTHPSGMQASDGWNALFATFEAVAGKLRFAGEHASEQLRGQGDIATFLGEMGATINNVLHQPGASSDALVAALGMHAGQPARKVVVTGTQHDVYREVFRELDDLQPTNGKVSAGARRVALNQRMRAIDAQLKQAGVNPNGEVRTWGIVLDAAPGNAQALNNLTPATESLIAASRLKAMAPLPSSGVVQIDDYGARLLARLKAPGMIGAVTALFAVLSWRNALDSVHTALAGKNSEAEWMLASTTAGLAAGAFDLLRVGIEHGTQHSSSLLGPIAAQVSPRFLEYVKVGGMGAGAVAMAIAAVVDFGNMLGTAHNGEPGVTVLYGARMATEGVMATQLSFDILAIATSGLIELTILSGPAMWVAIAAVAVISIAIAEFEDPPTLTWARDCYFGKKPDYGDDTFKEQSDYLKAMAGA